MGGDWKHGVFGCFDDCALCIITYFCPCYTFGKNAEAVGDSCFLCCLSQFIPFIDILTRTLVRGKIREQKGIDGSCIGDLICHLFCAACALCQEAQELKGAGPMSMARE